MLELVNIKKDYALKDQEPVHALKGITLNFRSNEFVAILGHSGCGKTTLLNITGGLDHYDSGDLIIKGVSTKDFKDNDWDTYRNHSIGFVFQTYNLIPHQTILKNVELALTISGIGKEERIARAKAALDSVGLGGLYKKKPNQLSGGQMQRVAIARALVNNPEIVLADEPTGALDSETSVQIMDLLKEVAKSHLVIMVTHNPELAEKYANRIVRMKDGLITDDSNPFDGKKEAKKEVKTIQETHLKGKKQSSMSFFTAGALSVSNLLSKFKRTLLVAIAGSIGIIGVSTILGVSCGVNGYIDSMQDDMLSSYPIEIAEQSIDVASLLTGLSSSSSSTDIEQFDTSTKVGMDSMIAYLLEKYTSFTNIKTNEIDEKLMTYIDETPKEYYSAINYDYSIDPTNNIFTAFVKNDETQKEIISLNGLTQRYIKTLMTVKGFERYSQFVDLFTSFMKQLPAEKDYLLSQYDLVGNSRFPENENELLLVVDEKSTLTDLILAQMGFYQETDFLNIAERAIRQNELDKQIEELKQGTDPDKEAKIRALEEEIENLPNVYPYRTTFNIEDILNHEFIYYPHDMIYQTPPTFVSHKQITANFSGTHGTNDYYLALTYNAETDTLIGNAIDVGGGAANMHNVAAIRMGDRTSDTQKSELTGMWVLGYTDGIKSLDDIDNIEKYLLTITSDGKTALEEGKSEFTGGATLMKVTSIDPIAFDPSDTAALAGKIIEIEPDTPDFYYEATVDQNSTMYTDLENNDGETIQVVGILRAKSSTNFGSLSRGVYFTKEFGNKYRQQANNSVIVNEFKNHITEKRYNVSPFNAYVHFSYEDYSDPDNPTPKSGYASALNGDTSSTIASIFAAFLSNNDDNLKTDKLHLRALAGLKVKDYYDETNPNVIDHHDIFDLPQSISIYPKSFETKNGITNRLDDWNRDKDLVIGGEVSHKNERSEITYSDTISMIITVISTLVTTVSAALISFTSLSLVVSCFMIAVITYISVMERVKEIGVIRSLGGRKKDVSRLFIAENLITGLSSGVIGIGVTYILQIIINIIAKSLAVGVPNICALPWYYALMMIGIAVLLSVLSGLIPSLSASKQDPVIALRTE